MARFLKRYHPPGTPPGTLARHEHVAPVPTRISMIDYDEHSWHEIVDIDPNECKSYLAKPTVTWIHVQGHVAPELMQQFGELFNLHALAMEDVLNSGQLPKTEGYDDQLFVIMSVPALASETVSIEQLSIVAADNYVVTIHLSRCVDGCATATVVFANAVRAICFMHCWILSSTKVFRR